MMSWMSFTWKSGKVNEAGVDFFWVFLYFQTCSLFEPGFSWKLLVEKNNTSHTKINKKQKRFLSPVLYSDKPPTTLHRFDSSHLILHSVFFAVLFSLIFFLLRKFWVDRCVFAPRSPPFFFFFFSFFSSSSFCSFSKTLFTQNHLFNFHLIIEQNPLTPS